MSVFLSTFLTLDFVSKLYQDLLSSSSSSIPSHSAQFGGINTVARNDANDNNFTLPKDDFDLLENFTVPQLETLELSKLDLDVKGAFEDFFEDVRSKRKAPAQEDEDPDLLMSLGPEYQGIKNNHLINIGFKEFYHKLHVRK